MNAKIADQDIEIGTTTDEIDTKKLTRPIKNNNQQVNFERFHFKWLQIYRDQFINGFRNSSAIK